MEASVSRSFGRSYSFQARMSGQGRAVRRTGSASCGECAMRWMILHRTNAHWETGALPEPELCQRVGTMVREIAEAGLLLAAEGLRPTSRGVRLQFRGTERTVLPG